MKYTLQWQSATPETRRAVRSWVVQSAASLIICAILLFALAGRVDWLWGWAWWLMLTAFMAAHVVILVPINPDLLAEREKGLADPRIKPWDRWLASVAGGILAMIVMVIAALNQRFRWAKPLPTVIQYGGVILAVAGYALFLWAMASNAYFAEGVRIQSDRGHSVAQGGPYRWVRHPGYLGSILSLLGAPLVLGALGAMVPSAIGAALFVLRTHLEDQTLQKELEGYAAYALRVPYRLVPGLW